MNNNDIIEISSHDWDISNDSAVNNSTLKSSNFGSGIELLMNERVKDGSNKSTSDIDIEDLNNLENELNNLVDNSNVQNSKYISKSDLFNSSSDPKPFVRFDDSEPNIGTSTSENGDSTSKTWDGYGKFNNIPINPDKHFSKEPPISKDELLREKFKYLRRLEALEKKGVELSKKYNMESPLAEMQGEYETIMDEKTKHNSIKFQGNMLMAIINGIEFLNNRFDPFDIKLDGWGEQINENVGDYDEIFSELYEKYKSRASMAPEVKLMFQLGGSAMMIHMTNTMFKSAMPGMDDILRQNPDLMRQFQSAAVNTMSQSSPGFSGFMNGVVNNNPSNSYERGPPPPLATQGPTSVPPPLNRPGNNNLHTYNNMHQDDGINFKENSEQDKSARKPRTEMKGPSDITDILSRLKTKTINIQEPIQPVQSDNNSSTISINDLKDIQSDGNIPKRSRRKPRSDKNTVSLDF
jgi:hypothetical protein